MSFRLLIPVLLLSFQSFGQSNYTFKDYGIQLIFPRKPSIDTTITSEGYKVRFIISKDSLGSYYLNFTEQPSNKIDVSQVNDKSSFMDGVMDSIRQKYNAEMISTGSRTISDTFVKEYLMKGVFGKTPIFIKSWEFLWGKKIVMCQLLYPIENEKVIKTKDHTFFESLKLFKEG